PRSPSDVRPAAVLCQLAAATKSINTIQAGRNTSDKGPTDLARDGNGTTPMAPLAPARQGRGGGRTAPPTAEDQDTGPVAHAGRVPHRGRQRGRSLPSGRTPVLVLVLLARHPDPLVPALVDPARRTDDRRVRRWSPRGFSDQGRDRGTHADIRDLHCQPC